MVNSERLKEVAFVQQRRRVSRNELLKEDPYNGAYGRCLRTSPFLIVFKETFKMFLKWCVANVYLRNVIRKGDVEYFLHVGKCWKGTAQWGPIQISVVL